MAVFHAEKVVSVLPYPLEPDTVYYVRTGEGFDTYVSDATGNVAHKQNGLDYHNVDGGTASTTFMVADMVLDGGLSA